MQVQVNTDKNIEGGDRLTEYVKTAINARLRRFGSQITRVEAHLSDGSSHKSHGDDKKCVLEARPAGLQPVVVTHLAETLDQAISGAAEKLERMLDSTFGQLNNPKSVPLTE
ncbi:MAG: ribosomal subunit interface protein [Burkholderiales bacterium RIFCSPHIGHO2_12_FULL_61_11]|nr:MAG: ribosomal subunit interface protein [Burkholderiales bacterium RIFCSPHIGHO2_12_FULL_61_11]